MTNRQIADKFATFIAKNEFLMPLDELLNAAETERLSHLFSKILDHMNGNLDKNETEKLQKLIQS